MIMLLLLMGCQQQSKKVNDAQSAGRTIQGHWQFLDGYGNYNEAWFAAATYQTFNRFVDRKVMVNYVVKGDSLISTVDMEGGSREIRAGLAWIGSDRVVIATSFVRDTLWRMQVDAPTLEDTDPFSDSLTFFTAFNKRYDDFLVSRGIVSREEIDAFRKSGEVPEDILEEAKKR